MKQKCIFAGLNFERIIHIKFIQSMKKTLLVLVAAVLTTMFASAQITDTIVSLTPSNRNVVLEEYTGINCQYCPDGHKIANQIMAAHPDRVSVINVHVGGYAANTYTTQFGNALADQTGLTGYPAGTINRHVFSGSNTDLSRSQWNSAANQIMNMASPVNIAAEGTLDWSNRTLNIRVQLYYTAAQTSVVSNALNIAIIQDNVLGSQVGGSTYNPAQMVGNQYNHMHMLRHLITGQWGETINDISVGTLVEKNYQYVIPNQLGSPNPIDAVIEDLQFVAFVCEGHQEILTGIHIPIQNINVPAINARLVNIYEIPDITCANSTNAYFEFKNLGVDNVTSLTYTYTLNGNINTGTWTGNVASMQTDTVHIPELTVTLAENNTLNVQITKINDQDVTISPKSLTIKKNVYAGGGRMKFKLVTDRYASETTFKFFDPNGIVVLEDGPWANLSSNSTTVHNYNFYPTTTGCFRLEVYDSYGDGINSGYGSGYFQLFDEEGVQIFKDNGKFGSKATYMIDVAYPASVEDITMENTTIYPNPATDVININTTENVQRVEIFNMQGQLVKAETGDVTSISVKDLANGFYTLKLTTDNGTSMHKIVKK